MREFIHDDFLLKTETARRLYHEFAAGLPIIDYHCHLDPRDLADDRVFENLTQVWIASDPYKHRAMRIAGVPERLITGDATDREKFDAWAATVPQTLGNPLFHWTALELKRYFGITEWLSAESAGCVWETCNALLRSPGFTARALIARANVECLCTSDRLQDDLDSHARLAQSEFATRVLPSLRVDDCETVDRALGAQRLDVFEQAGCRLADHALDDFRSDHLRFLASEYGRRGWIMQLHIGAQRQTSTRLRRLAGPAGGYATIGRLCDIPGLCRFLDDLDKDACLPRMILYPLNPADNAALATLTGSFAEDGVRGKIQFGPAWWYNDHALGIRNQLDALANYGLLSAFIGMTTDSRSLLSMTRHEYFRRVLCDWLGDQVQAGSLPDDDQLLGPLVRAVAYDNARRWLFPERTDKR
ncbi:MAG TPA: glucuronate isomerase [Candidatus Anammoximicrobium sp.]|nr:glucuronate isomerase [Candidatus Anammoximicrobium sp.]